MKRSEVGTNIGSPKPISKITSNETTLKNEMKDFYAKFPNVVVVALRNARKRYLVCSRQNYFGGIHQKILIIFYFINIIILFFHL